MTYDMVGLNQATTQLQQQQLIAATIAASQQQQQQQTQQLVAVAAQQQQQQQHQQQTVMPPPSSPAQNPILAMASMMNAAAGGNVSMTTAVTISSPMSNNTTTHVSSLPATPTKPAIEQLKTACSAPGTPSTATVNVNTAGSVSATPILSAEMQTKEALEKCNSETQKTSDASTTIITSTPSSIPTVNSVVTSNNIATQQSPAVTASDTSISNTSETPQLAVQPMETTEPTEESPSLPKQVNASMPTTPTTCSENTTSISKTHKTSTTIQSVNEGVKPSTTEISSSVSSSPDESTSILSVVSNIPLTNCTTSIKSAVPTNTITTSTATTATTNSTTTISMTNTIGKSSGPPPKSTPGATISKVEKDLPKAMIKPNVLTHVIDGFIIQEANEPFPVTRKRYTDKDDNDELPQKKQALDDATNNGNSNNNNSLSASPLPADMIECEYCGKPEHKTKLKKKRFCSPACARQAKGGSGEHQQQSQQQMQNEPLSATSNHNDSTNITGHLNNNINIDTGNALNISTPTVSAAVGNVDRMQTDNVIIQNMPVVTTTPQQIQPQNPTSSSNVPAVVTDVTIPLVPVVSAANTTSAQEQQPQMANWTVSEVCEFIKNLPGCSDYVDDFEQQEIDGQALLLLKENHLVNAMGMKLGPALKIVAKVESMKELSAATLNAINNAMDNSNIANS